MKIDKSKKDTKKTLTKVFIGILNAAFMYILIMLLVTFFFIIRWQSSDGPWSRGINMKLLIVSILPLCLLNLSMISCAIADLIMTIKLKRNPSDEKSGNVRKKVGKIFLISFVTFIVVGLAELLILVASHS